MRTPPGSLGFLLTAPGPRGACSQSAKDPRANTYWTLTTWSLPKASPHFPSVAQASWHLAPLSFTLSLSRVDFTTSNMGSFLLSCRLAPR